MNQEAIDILTAEPCASWLRERWEPKAGDQVYEPAYGDIEVEDFIRAGETKALLCSNPDFSEALWLPRVGDFLGEDGLLRQAGAIHYSFKHIGKSRPQLYVGKDITGGAAWEMWGDESAVLVFAKALQWLLERKQPEE